MSIDLHCHSTFSDGTKTPEELVALAKSKNLTGLSITDHDTVDAYPRFIKCAKENGLRFITGVEFSSMYEDTAVHILGYSFQLDHPAITELAHFHKKRRAERNSLIMEKLTKAGLPLSLQEIQEMLPHMSHQVGRAHIAYILFKKGLIDNPQEAFSKWIGEGKPCYVPSETPGIEKTVATIHEAGGYAVVAHPHLVKTRGVLKKILEYPFDGIEARYANFQPNANQRYIDMAKNRKIFITGGSDFHGEIRPHNHLGDSTTEEEVFAILSITKKI